MYEGILSAVETSNPFHLCSVERVVLIGDMKKVNDLTDSGRIVLKYIPETLDIHTGIAKLDVKAICMGEFNVYNATNATRIRRGIRNLKANKVIASTVKKHYYWINRGVIWK
jgi:hypothetical protein